MKATFLTLFSRCVGPLIQSRDVMQIGAEYFHKGVRTIELFCRVFCGMSRKLMTGEHILHHVIAIVG